MQPCPLCHSEQPGIFVEDKNRRYFRCQHCALIFADPEAQLSPEQEKAVYDQHQNNPDDMGYRQFLGRLATPLVERLSQGSLTGLDFGSGPGPTLSIMLEEMGYNMTIYDPYFAPDHSVLTHQYDFVTCTEAIEHFNQPAKEWGLLLSMIKPGGWLGLMTKLATDAEAFTRWHYKNDPTHVSFFSRDTFRFLAQRDGLEVEFVGNDVILLRKTQ
ncbi:MULTISPECIES: class I SAM-dependent methyltransferase [unclassified Photobacterium]|uniref:class I SAM-dependent methyltransferase n=1 Tax=unclassified Photobacterium TaxID=2628852 RepID=UPI001EE060A4|nr:MULTISPECIES: class I SAM-dependent methyltransferase [unclassified Photobacterium]MCG3864313.1 class I SAM-dependent methyltransferase [Photobacterium sp. Ph6]MCG3875843.1 class I SAM-dependent methyltransferase [Photobacterium sp. Ph5]